MNLLSRHQNQTRTSDDSNATEPFSSSSSTSTRNRSEGEISRAILVVKNTNDLTWFIRRSIVVLLSSLSQAIIEAAMKMLDDLLFWLSPDVQLALVKADLIPELVITLNPLSLSLTKAVDIHTYLVKILRLSVRISSPRGLAELEIEDGNEQQAVHKTVLQQVHAPSEKYICHLCVNRYSIVNGKQSEAFLELLTRLIWICPYYQPTMDFVLRMPVILTIPSSGMEHDNGNPATDMEDNASNAENGGLRRCDGVKAAKRQKRINRHEQEAANVSYCFCLHLDNKHCLCVIFVGSDITSSFAGTILLLSRQSPSMVATLSFAATLALLVLATILSGHTSHRRLRSLPPSVLSGDCEDKSLDSEEEKAVVFRSLVATVKLQPVLDDSLEAKAVRFLESIHLQDGGEPADAFLGRLAFVPDESLTDFIQSILVLISTPSQPIIKASMKMLDSLFASSSKTIRLALVQADLIPRLFIALNVQSISFAETVSIHVRLLKMLRHSLWLQTPHGLSELEIKDGNAQQTVHETVLKQVFAPSEKYICHLCANRYSIVGGDVSYDFMTFLCDLVDISQNYGPAVDFVLHMPVVLTIPSCLAFIDDDYSISYLLSLLVVQARKWNETRGAQRQMGKTVDRVLRMEGIDEVTEGTLRNDQKAYSGARVVSQSIKWNNLLGMNLPRRG
ncbi:hypothetical protein BLNAU_11078 [Blattamonas nauphoetae]|uniref:Uncharacterized protein n=1 Tax=Blattamonas nauphoetae TaxID=2049346 RepID=A0ABQ9XNH0_9EUKA|nr:hypothetical protein BLNAU_11078 [Blattamonas nauphoetae]